MKTKMLVLATLCGSTTVANAIELIDYTDPNTAYDEAYLDFNANAKSGNQDQNSYNALLSGFYNKRDSTEKRVLNLNINGNLSASQGGSEDDKAANDFGVSISGSRDVYFSDSREKLFYFAGGEYATQDRFADDDFGVSLGIGYGRVWNATPLARALRVQEELLDRGFLRSAMSDEAVLALGTVIGKEDEYRARGGADEYRGMWYADMEQVILDSGVFNGETLSALATVELDQVLSREPISPRRHGWLVRAGAGMQFSDFTGVADSDPKLTFQLEYSKPYGLRGQLIELATYEPIFGDSTVQTITNDLSYSYEMSDRIDWINTWRLILKQADDDGKSRTTSNILESKFLYKLSNQLDLALTVTVADLDEKNAEDTDVDTTANLSLRYRLK